jgi:predicted DNA-binding transcriptional regulator YafY
MPLDAPEHDDIDQVLLARAVIEPLFGPAYVTRIIKIGEDMDERRRRHAPAGGGRTRKAMSSVYTLGSRIEPQLLLRLHAACRMKTLRIRYVSPWSARRARTEWQDIEPWALQVHDGAIFLRAWSRRHAEPRKFRVAHIEAVEELADRKGGAPRQPVPVDVWREETTGYGIDRDRPGVALLRVRGGVARWIAPIVWHPEQKDLWLEPDELLERTIPYRSCRELARRLASVIDGIESIEPRELRDEVFGLFARSKAMSRPRKRRPST